MWLQDVSDAVAAKPRMSARGGEREPFPNNLSSQLKQEGGRSFHHTQRHSPSEYKGLQWSSYTNTQHVASNYTDICLAIKLTHLSFKTVLSLENGSQKLLIQKALEHSIVKTGDSHIKNPN